MSGEDQERFEDYLELEQYIEELQAGHVAHPPEDLTPGNARIYRMAAFFRSASPDEATPRPEFIAELQARLEQELQQPSKPQPLPALQKKSQSLREPGDPQKKPRSVSRRTLLTGGAAIAASVTVGVGIGYAAEQVVNNGEGSVASTWGAPLVPNGKDTTWHFVTTLATLGKSAIRFTTGTIVGYVIRDGGNDNDGYGGSGDNSNSDRGKVIAMSAACTHMGCIVQWQDSDRKFHCPCHGGLFSEYGEIDKGSAPIRYLYALPRLDTIVKDGNVYVRVPK